MAVKLGLAVSAALALFEDPFDNVAAVHLVDALADAAVIRAAYRRMLRGLSPEAAGRLRELTYRPIDFDALRAQGEATFGRRLMRFIDARGIRPDEATYSHAVIAERFAADWATCRFVRLHDMLHFLLGFDVDPPGELGLQVFNWRNYGEPYGALAIASVPRTLIGRADRDRMLADARKGWRLGGRLPNLYLAPIEEMLGWDLDAALARLSIPPELPFRA